MTGTEVFAIAGGVISWLVAVGLAYRALQRARATTRESPSLDEASDVLEEPER